MRFRSALLLFAFTLAACRAPATTDGAAAQKADDDVPAWLADVIRQLEREPVANPPAYVARYRYGGRNVYYVPPRCCDVMGVVYETDGRVLCHPDGGITGTGDGRCRDFAESRTDEHIVWRDARSGT